MTIDQLIEKYIALRAKKQAMEKEHETALAPYKQAMETIEGFVLDLMVRQKVDSFSARGIGTAYKTTTLQATVKDRQALLGEVVTSLIEVIEDSDSTDEAIERCTPLFDPFTNAVSKDWVKEYLERKAAPPPGVEVSHHTKVGFRKA